MKFRNPNNSVLNKRKLMLFLRRMRDRLSTNEGGNLNSAISSLHNLFYTFFTKLGKPIFTPVLIRKGDDPDPEPYNEMVNDIKQDLEACFEEAALAAQLTINNFNIGQTVSEELTQRSNEAASKTIDLKLFAGQLDQELIIAGDDFLDTSKVDLSFPLQNPPAEVRTQEGIAALNRIESIAVTNLDTRVSVTPLTPIGVSSTPTTDNTNRFYEGNFFDYIGNARPEGGVFHLEERLHPEAREFAEGDSEVIKYDLQDTGSVFGGAIDQRVEGERRQAGLPLRTEDIVVIDRGASPEEKDFIRGNMVDSNPDTFWEAEYVVNAEEIQDFVESIDDSDIADTTPAQLRAKAVQADSIQNIDLEVQVTLELSEVSPVNWVSLNPMNFGETAWLEITEVSTAEDQQAGFVPIEGFDANRFANVLTDEANEELQEGIVSDTLAPSRFSFRGSAVYTFAVREAKFIRIKIKQRVPVPDPYQRLAIQLNRTITSIESYSRASGGKGCCFIFLEARYGDGTMDEVVRMFRDEHMTSRNRRGYYKLAEVLVPLMRKSRLVKFLVRLTMTDPLVSYGKYYYGKNKTGWMFKPVTSFWLKLFNYLGKDHPYLRENGEIV